MTTNNVVNRITLIGLTELLFKDGLSKRPSMVFLSSPSHIAEMIRLQANHPHELRAIVRRVGEDGRNYWGGGGGGGGGSGGDGDGNGEEFEEDKESSMIGRPWWLDDLPKDEEVGGWDLEVDGSVVQPFGFDEGFFSWKNAAEYKMFIGKMLKELEIAEDEAKARVANFRRFYLLGPVSLSPPIEVNAGSIAEIMYSCPDKELQNAAGYQKLKEKMLKGLEIAFADVAKARVGNFKFYLPSGPVSLSPPIEVNAGSIAEIMYACPDKELQAKAMVANFRLFNHPGHVSLSPSIGVNAGSTTAILYACPDKELQADVDGDGALKFVFVSFHLRKLANDELLKKAFAFFDQNKSGHIGLKEVIKATAHCSTQIRCISMTKPVQIGQKNPGN